MYTQNVFWGFEDEYMEILLKPQKALPGIYASVGSTAYKVRAKILRAKKQIKERKRNLDVTLLYGEK